MEGFLLDSLCTDETATLAPMQDDTNESAPICEIVPYEDIDGGLPPTRSHPLAVKEDYDLRPDDPTDVGQAYILAREYGECLRTSPATGYLAYSGTVWEESEAKAHGCLHELTERQLTEAQKALKELARQAGDIAEALASADPSEQSELKDAQKRNKDAVADALAYQRFVLQCRNSSKISGILTEASTPLALDPALLDADGFLLNTPCGEIDLRTGELLPHKPEHFHTKITDCTPSDKGADRWKDFLRVITCGDFELESYLQISAGMFAVGRVYDEGMQIAVGNGSNGKSTFYNTLSRVLGDYSGQISAETLTTGRKTGKNWELAEVRGKRLIIAPELEEGTRLDASFAKRITSTDRILAEKKYKQPFSFEPSHTVVLFTNHLPRVGGLDDGIWRRLTVIPFDAKIEGSADIKNYADVLAREAGGAVLAWIIEGARCFIKSGYRIEPPERVRKATGSYKNANDWLAHFLTDCCDVGEQYREKGAILFNAYREYCENTREWTRQDGDFALALEGAGFERKVTNRGKIWLGLRVRTDFECGTENRHLPAISEKR